MPDTLMQTPGPQSAKPWLQSYPPGMPSHIDPLPYNSIGDLFVQSCKKYADRAAFYLHGQDADLCGSRGAKQKDWRVAAVDRPCQG